MKEYKIVDSPDQREIIEMEKEISRYRRAILGEIAKVHYINKTHSSIIKTTLGDVCGGNAGTHKIYFLIQQVLESIARCYFLDLPGRYDGQDSHVKANLSFLYKYFGIEEGTANDVHKLDTLLSILISREQSNN